jgi:hypothetical protein
VKRNPPSSIRATKEKLIDIQKVESSLDGTHSSPSPKEKMKPA